MTAVALAITQPLPDAVLDAATAELAGALAGPAPAPLYFRWYSSEHVAEKDKYSLNPAALADPAVAYPASLGVGTQTITLTATDQPGQDQAAQNAVRHGGVAGPRVVHVLRAVIRTPAPNVSLSRTKMVLEADGSMHWLDKGYQDVNRLRYRWRFEPAPDDGRPSAELTPELVPDASGPVPVLRWAGALPAVGLGAYRLILRVSIKDSNRFVEAGTAVVITG